MIQDLIFKILINVQIPGLGGQSISVWGVFKTGEGWSMLRFFVKCDEEPMLPVFPRYGAYITNLNVKTKDLSHLEDLINEIEK